MIGIWLVGWTLVAGVGANAPPQGEPLPVVVLVGDSIRMGYAAGVADRLRGRARIVAAADNGGSSRKVLHHLDDWVIRHRPAVVHFGAGLHDIMTDTRTGAKLVEPAEYHANIRAIVRRLTDETSARLIFATTTPVLAARRVQPLFLMTEADVLAYNSLALRVLGGWSIVAVDDLHARAIGFGLEQALAADGVHFTPAGSGMLAAQVAEAVERALVDPAVARVVSCRRARVSPRIDGRVAADPAWAATPVVDHFAQFWSGQPVPHRTEARLLWDDDALYFAATLGDDAIVAVGHRPNDRVWLGDAFGLIIQPDDRQPASYEFQVNPAALALQLAIPRPGADFATLATQPALGMVAAAASWRERAPGARGWAVEGRIPWAAFGPATARPVPGSAWRVTLFRSDSDQAGSRPSLTSAAPLRRPDVHRLEESSQLRFEP